MDELNNVELSWVKGQGQCDHKENIFGYFSMSNMISLTKNSEVMIFHIQRFKGQLSEVGPSHCFASHK